MSCYQKVILIFFYFILVCSISCQQNYEKLFKEEFTALLNKVNKYSYVVNYPLPQIFKDKGQYKLLERNIHLERLLNAGKNINPYLFGRVNSSKIVKITLEPLNVLLSEGDLCIYLLLLINDIDFESLFPEQFILEGEKYSKSFFWHKIQQEQDLRDHIILKIKSLIEF